MNLFTDCFSTYSTFAQFLAKWNGLNSGGMTVGTPYAIGVAPQGLHLNSNFCGVNVPGSSRQIIGLRRKIISTLKNVDLFRAYNANSQQGGAALTTSGTIQIKGGTTVVATSSLTVVSGSTHYYEVDYSVNNTTGTISVYVDGVLFVTFTGDTQATANSIIDQWVLGGGGSGFEEYCADCYINDTTGSVNNARQGDVSILPFPVASAGTFADFLRGGTDTGTNAGQLAKALADSASYNIDNIVNHRDSFTMAALASGTIVGARLWAHIKKDAAGARLVALTVESSGTDDIGTGQGPSQGTDFGWLSRSASVNPNTSALWANAAALNAAKMGYKITV